MGKKKCPEFENHERWLVSYADMLTLLFAVFVVLFALKDGGGDPQVKKTAGSMQESFNTPLEDIPIDRRLEAMEQGFGIFEHFQGNQLQTPINPEKTNSKEQTSIISNDLDRVKQILIDRLYGPNRFRGKDSSGHERIIAVERTRSGFKVQLLGQHFYAQGAIAVRKSAMRDLDSILKVVKDLGRDIRVEGHTDSLPAPGSLSNWDLSALRATRVVAYMISKHKFPHTRLSAAGFGDIRPIGHNGTKAGRQLNRRIEIHVDYQPNGSGDSQ